MLDQVVVRVARERERIQPQRVHLRQPQQTQVRIGSGQVLRVEVDQVVPDQKRGTVGQPIELGETRLQMATAKMEGLAGIAPHGREAMDSTVVPTDFEVDRKTARRKRDGVGGWLAVAPGIDRSRGVPNATGFRLRRSLVQWSAFLRRHPGPASYPVL